MKFEITKQQYFEILFDTTRGVNEKTTHGKLWQETFLTCTETREILAVRRITHKGTQFYIPE